jgi:hypothetical protein
MPKSEHDAPPIRLPVAESNADDGGLRIAYRALRDSLVAQGKTAHNPIDGYTESQRFFLSFAQGLCESIRPTRAGAFLARASMPPRATQFDITESGPKSQRVIAFDRTRSMARRTAAV